MSSIKEKIFQTFKNMKSDAVPRPPRPDGANDDEEASEDQPQEAQPPRADPENGKKEKQNKKNSFFIPHSKKKKKNSVGSNDGKNPVDNIVNTQASGNVINIVNSRDFHWGNEYVYYMGTKNGHKDKDVDEDSCDEDHIEKDNLITLILEADDEPEHPYLDYISKNLGKNWHSFFRKLGYTKGRIETMEIDEARNGVSEARYKLLLDWVRNDDTGSLGRLATQLWQHGERQIVKDLALMYDSRRDTTSCNKKI